MDSGVASTGWALNVIPMVLGAILVAVLAVMILSVVASVRASRRRHESIAAIVTACGFRYVAKDQTLVTAFEGAPFGTGSALRAGDVVTGHHAGGWFQTFAYSYDTPSFDAKGNTSTETHRFQVTWIPLGAWFPHLRITPEHGPLREHIPFAGRDLNTESAAFNNQWRVRATEERLAHAILTGPMIERLLQADVRERAVIFQGPRLMSFSAKVSDLSDLIAVVSMLQSVASRVPPFVVSDLGGRQAI